VEADEAMICKQCYDITNNRPRNGKPCKCGKTYAPEIIVFDPGDRGTSALASAIDEGERYDRENGVELDPWSPRYCGSPRKSIVGQLNQESFLI
jgi:hypothetical protein